MPTESLIFAAAVVAMFLVFMSALAYAQRSASGRQR